MTPEREAEICSAFAAANPTWTLYESGSGTFVHIGAGTDRFVWGADHTCLTRTDAVFAAGAYGFVRDLLAEVKRLRGA